MNKMHEDCDCELCKFFTQLPDEYWDEPTGEIGDFIYYKGEEVK